MERRGIIIICISILLFYFSVGCIHLSRTEERDWGVLLDRGKLENPIKYKKAWIAGTLDFLIPGTGHLYLNEWTASGVLFLSNIFWPLSAGWGLYAAILDTETVNKKLTIECYQVGPCKHKNTNAL